MGSTMPFVGMDDALNQRMPDDILLLEANQGNALDVLQGRLGLHQSTALAAG